MAVLNQRIFKDGVKRGGEWLGFLWNLVESVLGAFIEQELNKSLECVKLSVKFAK